MKKSQFLGRCHCGNVSYQFDTDLTIKELGIRKCDCSFCLKNGARYISDPMGELTISVQDENSLQKYQFGTQTAEFLRCSHCGVMPACTCEIEGILYGIININTLDKVEHFGRHAKVMSYEEETLEERLNRRKQNWIGNVKIITG